MTRMNLTLRAGEKLYLNGAVVRVDRKVIVELLNDATFLLEHHVLQARDAITPLRQVYFAIQIMLMEPANANRTWILVRDLLTAAMNTYATESIKSGLRETQELVETSRAFEALKLVRSLFEIEDSELSDADQLQRQKG